MGGKSKGNISNEHIRRPDSQLSDGTIKRRELCVHVGIVNDMHPQGKRKRGRPKRRNLDAVKEDMQEVGAREDEVFARSVWRIHCRDP